MLDSSPVDAAARGRLLTYLWVGFAGIATMAVLGVIAGQTFGRQLRLARLKTDLTAAVSHELRAPLASVRVLVDGLLGDETLDPVKTREYLHLIAGEHARLSRLVENFLTFARLERSRERFVLVPTRPSTIVASSMDAIRERTPAGCDLRVEMPDDLPQVMADPDALGTALHQPPRQCLEVHARRQAHPRFCAYVDDRMGSCSRCATTARAFRSANSAGSSGAFTVSISGSPGDGRRGSRAQHRRPHRASPWRAGRGLEPAGRWEHLSPLRLPAMNGGRV